MALKSISAELERRVEADASPAPGAATMMSRMLLQYEIEQFYYAEAALLDDRRFGDWLALFAEDAHYWMPIRRTVTSNELEREFTAPGAMAFFDDDRMMLAARVKKLASGYSWSEDPPSRTRHLVTNLRIVREEGGELGVDTNFHLYRTRLNSEEDHWIGSRKDVLRRTPGGLKIVTRHIFLEQTVLLSRNLSSFF
jgi:3-phenylpropionate/cinnamic acid dioxygenase small subunit